jgi:hypothetical protein
MKYSVKLIVGFRRDQEHSIPAVEAHKAYYLFTHPDERGIFSNGLAIKGDQIQEIVPDYHNTVGWNASHQLNDDDWNELRGKGIMQKMQFIMSNAKEIGTRGDQRELSTPLNELLKGKSLGTSKEYTGAKSMKELLTVNHPPLTKTGVE